MHTHFRGDPGIILLRSQTATRQRHRGPSRGPLRLRFIVMDAANCTPVPGARIEVWHARADGYYCGYPGQGDSHNVNTTGDTFMRGTRIEDALGEASSAPSTPAGTKSVP